MIEPDLVKWLDLGDSMQKADIYLKGSFLILFRFFRVMLQHKTGNIVLVIILKFVFFLQIMMIAIINNPSKDSNQDTLIQFLHYIKQIIFIQDLIAKKSDYIIFLTIGFVLILIIYILIFYILANSKGKIQETPVKLLNILSLFLQNYLLCPIVNVFMLSVKCENSRHIFFNFKCFDDYRHLIIVCFSLFSLASFLIYSFLLSLFYYQVGGIKTQDLLKRVNCNFEFYVNFFSMIYYFISFYLQYYTKESQSLYHLYNRIFFFVITNFLFLYMYFKVFYYDKRVNTLNLYGWGFLWWYSVGLLLKKAFKIKDISIFVIVGSICLCFILFFLEGYNTENYLIQANILEASSIKQIEKFTYNLLDIVSHNTIKSKTLVSGIINSIEEFFESQPEIYEKYENFLNNKIMINKLGGKSNTLFNIYNIIYVVYDFYLEKAEMKENIMILICYFLMNNLKNPTYAAFLTATIKVNGIRILYLKFLLVEDIKDFLISKLIKNSSNKESIKHIEIGSVIVYDNYIDSFKMKIYDAACNQVDYFDILKNNTLSSKATKNFLKVGDSILRLRKEINSLWNKIIKLNPFSDEIEKDYMLYLRTIIQDEDLAQKEEKRYYHIKMSKLSEKHNIYHSLFDKDVSSVILVDGCGLIGKIIYVTPNFGIIYNFLPKELVNIMITDLQPSYIAQFHKDIMVETLKYSNLNYIFPNLKNIVMKVKGNCIFNINAYIKCLPNFDYGLIYILAIEKVKDNQFIVLLDHNFNIIAMTNPYGSFSGSFNALNNINNYNLSNSIVGYHCSIIIPDILKLIKFNEDKFILMKSDIDLKGILYPNTERCNEFTSLINCVLDRIKQSGQLIYDENIAPSKHTLINQYSSQNSVKLRKEQNLQEFHELVNHIKEICENKSYSIFYRITSKSFLNDKYNYYKVFITNDLMNANDYNINSSISKFNISEKSKAASKTSIGNNIPSHHQLRGIRIKVTEDDNHKNEKTQKKKMKNENEENNQIERQLSQNSLTTKSSVDSASFNKLKSKILEKNEPNIITYMKLSALFFLIMTIVLIYLNNDNAKDKLKFLEEYLDQNFYFNHTKITTICVYATGVNLKFLRYKILNDTICITSSGCKTLYVELLSRCLNDIKNETAKVAYFNDDYKQIMGIGNNISIYIYNLTSQTNISLDGPNLLNFILSNGLRFKNNINDYLINTDSEFQIYGENIIEQGYYYMSNDLIEGFNRNTLIKKITEKRFSTNYIYVILNCIVFGVTMSILIYMTVKLYHIQKYFISKLVKFHSVNFEGYIKYLEDLKKKLRNDSGEEEDKNEGENLSNNLNNNEKQNTQSDEKEKKKKSSGKRESSILRDTNKQKRFSTRKKMQGKMSKIQQQKQEKINIMCKYIFQFNLILAFKMCSLLILSMLYYVIVYILYFQKRREYLNFDDIINNIYGIYKECNIIFANLLHEASEYQNFMIKRDDIISMFEDGSITSIKYNEKYYSNNNYTLMKNLKYNMDVPSSSDISIPTVNNILLPIISNVKMNKKSTKAKLAQLFNGDICEIIFEKNVTQYNICAKFWSSILKQGLTQCITQMTVEINTILDEMVDLNQGIITFKEFINKSTFTQLETFVNYYFLESFRKNEEFFNIMRGEKLNLLHKILNILLFLFFIALIALFIILFLIIYSAKSMFSSFLSFIGIIPIQYLFEDENFYKDVLKIEDDIFD